MENTFFQTLALGLAGQPNLALALAALGGLFFILFVVVAVQLRAHRGVAQQRLAEADHQIQILREGVARGDRAETLLHERRAEAERLGQTVEALRERIEAGQGENRTLAQRLAALDMRRAADGELLTARDDTIRRLTGQIDGLRDRLEEEQLSHQGLKARISALEAELEAEMKAAEEKITLLSQVRGDMQERFRLLADEALRTQGETFSKVNTERLEATLSPLKEHVGHFEKELREVHQETVKDRERLKAEIANLTQRSEQISREAVQLTRALKGDRQQQGAWGEMILEGILERSGLRAGEEYVTQAHRTGVDGERLRPDVVVNIPGGKSLVIDSKVSLNDYAASVNATDDGEAALFRRRHLAAIRNHINGLSAKSYQLAEGQSLDYVIMFVPIEGALSEALREDGKLTEYALERHITIATPTTLMMALRTVSQVWAVERRNQNADEIARRAGLLYDKVANFVASMERVGKGIEGAQTAYESAIGQLSRGRGNVLSQVETLKTMGAKTSKAIGLDFDAPADDQAQPSIGRDDD
ncbi:DNA recombination protein rmuC-like protein [Ketogulonicigenium robustum]|uniref:DNA recombination protein RmuC homolog n=1 Tax=Ketogulonicigenium robustum TaxID=92947 RepID=A0A1W6NX94_9RHOB|nr:DNA recombination protein RmuC [Ketogulonicigenium robustum]ARO13868.1 DNA recombination protein rmuC-like protein [Ketogulonicigenium robustum]